MGLFSLLPVAALIYAFFAGDGASAGHSALPLSTGDAGFEWIVAGQSLVVAMLVVASIRLARGRGRSRRRG